MTLTIDWQNLRATYSAVESDSDRAGRVRVPLGSRKQWVEITVDAPDDLPAVLRLSSPVMSRERALEALILPIRSTDILSVDEDEDEGDDSSDEDSASPGNVEGGLRLLSLLAHNDKLRGIHLHLDQNELRASSDLICVSGTVDADLLCARIDRLAQIADGMELRATGVDER